ncbi:MAG: hypothetical protein IKX25_06170 [Bacteroidales bacterium]|nr:hypothetical protein [Bacteroidales bacterium]
MLQITNDVLAKYKPRHLRLSLWLVYNRLTNYILLDNGENDVCANEDNLPEAMEILREIIDALDEDEHDH